MTEFEDLKSCAAKACLDIYLSLYVLQTRDVSEPVKEAWSIGQELYLKQCDHTFVSADNKVVRGCLICTKCKTIRAA